jgi:hypothetical protein
MAAGTAGARRASVARRATGGRDLGWRGTAQVFIAGLGTLGGVAATGVTALVNMSAVSDVSKLPECL